MRLSTTLLTVNPGVDGVACSCARDAAVGRGVIGLVELVSVGKVPPSDRRKPAISLSSSKARCRITSSSLWVCTEPGMCENLAGCMAAA